MNEIGFYDAEIKHILRDAGWSSKKTEKQRRIALSKAMQHETTGSIVAALETVNRMWSERDSTISTKCIDDINWFKKNYPINNTHINNHIVTKHSLPKQVYEKPQKFDPIAFINNKIMRSIEPALGVKTNKINNESNNIIKILVQEIIDGKIKNHLDLEKEKTALCSQQRTPLFSNKEIFKNIDKKYLINFR